MRVFLRGTTWWGDWHDEAGRRRRGSLGLRTPDHGRDAALRELRRRLGLEGGPYTVGDLFRDWLAWKSAAHAAKPRTVEALEHAARVFNARWGRKAAEDLAEADVEAFATDRLRSSVSSATLNRDLDLLRNALRWAVDRGKISKAPRVERLPSARRRVPKYLGADEIERLLSAARDTRLEPVVRLALGAGLRIEETRWLTWGDVDLDRGALHVATKPGWSPKSHAERTVPLHPKFADWLKRWRDELAHLLGRDVGAGDWVAPFIPTATGRGGGQGEPGVQWVRGTLGQAVRRLFDEAQIPAGPHTLHKLRGTFAVRSLEGGGSLEALRSILGHAELRTTAAYLSATDRARRQAVEVAGWDE